jgi:undecaprenyl-diphosphatase
MTPFDALILGVVEGVTEFLPISSTGHLILASALLGLQNSDFQKTFEIVIQLGAILAVVVLYFKSFFDIEILKRLIVAFIPTGVIGLALYHVVKTYLLGNEAVVLSALSLGGLALIVFEMFHVDTEHAVSDVRAISYKQAATLGLFQAVAIVPGVSRSAATIVGGLIMGINRETIVQFSFLLAVPTMVAASGLDLLKSAGTFHGSDALTLGIGFVVSFIVALFSVRWLISYVKSRTFTPFGFYRVLAAVAFYLLVIR